MAMASNSDNEDQANEIENPLVFQCGNCMKIVGDSYSLLRSNEELKLITLSSASNVQRSPDAVTPKMGLDEGSTFSNFVCSNCGHSIGRYYWTTKIELDYLREKFSFLVDEITCYELGKSQFGSLPEVAAGPEDPIPTSDGNIISLDSLNVDVMKSQRVILSLVERIERIEDIVGIQMNKRSRLE